MISDCRDSTTATSVREDVLVEEAALITFKQSVSTCKTLQLHMS